jgi:hypothetical protein
MTHNDKVNAKPSDSINNEDVLRAKAQASNQKRKSRQAEQKREEQEKRWEEENRMAEEAARRQAQADAQREADQKLKEEEERIRREEEAMWASAEPKQEKSESKPRSSSGTKIKVTVDGQSFDNLSAAMAHVNPAQWLKRNDYRDSCWTKINRKLKKEGVCVYDGHTYKLI